MQTYRLTLIAVLIFVGVFPLYFVGPKTLESFRISRTLFDAQTDSHVYSLADTPAGLTCLRMAAVIVHEPEDQDTATRLQAVLHAMNIHAMTATPDLAPEALDQMAQISPGGVGLLTIGWAARETVRLYAASPIRIRVAFAPVLDVQTMHRLGAAHMTPKDQNALKRKLQPLFPKEDLPLLDSVAFDDPRQLSRDGLALWRLIHSTDPALGDLLISRLSRDTRDQLDALTWHPPEDPDTDALSRTVVIFDSDSPIADTGDDTGGDTARDQIRQLFGQEPAIRSLPLSQIRAGQKPEMTPRQWIGLMLTLYGLLSARDATAVAHAKHSFTTCLGAGS